MLTSQNNKLTIPEAIFKWQVTVGDEVFELSDNAFQNLLQKEQQGVRLVKINDKLINPAFISSAKKIFKEEVKPASEFLDWSVIPEKVVPTEKSVANREKITSDIRKMLKERNRDWKPKYKDAIHEFASNDVWEHLKSVLTTLKFPMKDESWKVDPSITKHNEGRESHSVAYYTKIIDLGDGFDNKFWAEANYIFCPACRKNIREQIVIYNDYECDSVSRNYN
jgi:hypothetical protein